MDTAAPIHWTERFEIADQLLAGRQTMLTPQDLPGRYGRVVKAVDRLLRATNCEAVLAGGWAVWRHGYDGRLTQDVDIALPAQQVQEFMRVATVSGFTVLPQKPGRWPKLLHKETGVKLDILPEGERPGTASKPAPTTIPHPSAMGAIAGTLHYVTLSSLIELKIAAGRVQDEADVVKLIQTNPEELAAIRQHLSAIHPTYVETFDYLVRRAEEQEDH